MVAHVALFLFALFATVLSAPAALDQNTLLKNAQTAQVLNTRFQSMSRTDKCNDEESACIDGQHAACNDSAWKLTRCPGSRKCFALPSIRRPGTFVGCTSESNALSIIKGAGGKGGIVSTEDPNPTIPLPILNPTDTTPQSIPTSTRMMTPTLGGPLNTVTPPTVTSTLSPEEAYSQLMSLLSVGASPVRTSSMSEPTFASLPPSTSVTTPPSASSSTVLPSFTSINIPKISPEPTSTCDDY